MEIIDIIDEHIAEISQQFLAHLLSERGRLSDVLPKSYCYKSNPKFLDLINQLVEFPAGDILRCTENEVIDTSSGPREDQVTQATKYSNLQLMFSYEGKDCFGKTIQKPTCVVALPERQRFAVLHNRNTITIFSTSGQPLQSFYFVEGRLDTPNCPEIIRIDPTRPNCFITLHEGIIKTINGVDKVFSDYPPENLKSCSRIRRFEAPPFGFAVSSKHNRLYTTIGCELRAYSIETWDRVDEWRIPSTRASNKAMVLAVHDDELFFRGDDGRCLYAIPIDPVNGALLIDNMTQIDQHFEFVRSLTFDADGNMLVVDKAQRKLIVLSHDGKYTLAVCGVSKALGAVYMGDVALIESTDLLPQISSVIAVPDFLGHRLLFFASPK